MGFYRKKPVVVEAIQWTGSNLKEVIAFKDGPYLFKTRWSVNEEKWQDYQDLILKRGLEISTLEGKMLASIGDWIIQGVNGEFYPCKPDIFEKTYEQVSG